MTHPDVPVPANPLGDVRSDVGLLDVEEHDLPTVALAGEGEDRGPYAVGTFRKIGSGLAVLTALVIAPYLVPDLDARLAHAAGVCAADAADDPDAESLQATPEATPEAGPEADCSFARAWIPGESVPFWNVIGREFLGEGESEEQAQAQVAEAGALAQTLLAKDDERAPPPPDKPIIKPPPDSAAGTGLPPYQPHPDDGEAVGQSLEMPTAQALDSFFEALARSDAGYEGAITRVTQWGDSAIANDNVSSALRNSMQRRFGDAGHGFHLLAKPNASYRHRGIRFSASNWQLCYIINKCKNDGHFGLGGTTVWSAGGAESAFDTVPDEAFGRAWSRAELWYAAEPKGGRIRVSLDDAEPTYVETGADALEDRWYTVTANDGPHALEVRAAGGGRVRMYGVVFERDVPGVVWDGMEQLGAFTSRMLYFDPDHLQQQVAHRDSDLLVFMFGGNDLMLSGSRVESYEETWRDALLRFRGPPEGSDGKPARACLVVAPVDHGQRKGQQIISRPEVAEITARQRRAAQAAGCAFFDTPAAMGGDGAAGRWRRADQPLLAGDLSHLTNAGQKVVGHYIYLALMEQYVAYRRRTDAG